MHNKSSMCRPQVLEMPYGEDSMGRRKTLTREVGCKVMAILPNSKHCVGNFAKFQALCQQFDVTKVLFCTSRTSAERYSNVHM